MDDTMISVITPTYNRGEKLKILYKSLLKQTSSNFEWIIVDDGSIDDTESIVNAFKNNNQSFEIIYVKKINGGKHSALNYSHDYISGNIVLIVDSDDWIVENAIECISNNWMQYKNDKTICGMTFLRGHSDRTPLYGKIFKKNRQIEYSIKVKVNDKNNVDSCEVIRSNVFKEFKFPIFANEIFMGESYLWNKLSLKYKTVFINEVLYITEYLEGGLTLSGRKLRLKCPLGGMENSKTYFNNQVCMKQRVKNTILYVCYGNFAGLKPLEIIKSSEQLIFTFFIYPFGFFLYKFWKVKYKC